MTQIKFSEAQVKSDFILNLCSSLNRNSEPSSRFGHVAQFVCDLIFYLCLSCLGRQFCLCEDIFK